MDPLVVARIFLLIGSLMSAVGGVAAAWAGHVLEMRNERSTRCWTCPRARSMRMAST